MSDQFVRDMRQQVLESISPGSSTQENPLRTIGLSEQILDIGLSDDELYDYCRYQARYLTAQFHRDKPEMQTPAALEKQHRYEAAFNRIKSDRVAFEEALAEFRMLKSAEKSSLNFLRRSLEVTRDRLGSYQARELDLAESETHADQVRTKTENSLAAAEAIKERQAGRVAELGKDMEKLTAMLSRQENISDASRTQLRYLLRYVTHLSMDVPGQIHVWDAKWILVAKLVDAKTFPPGLITRGGKFTPGLKKLGISPEVSKEILTIWSELQKRFRPSKKWVTIPQAGLLEIANCRVKSVQGLSIRPGRWGLLGSMPTKFDRLYRHTLQKEMERDAVFETLSSLLIPGGILVLQSFYKWSEDKSFENTQNPRPLFDWSTNHIILAVG